MNDIPMWVEEVIKLYFEGNTLESALDKVHVMKSDYEKLFKCLTIRG